MKRERCEDQIEIDQNLDELTVETLQAYLHLVQQCRDCRGCQGLEEALINEIAKKLVKQEGE